MSKRVAATIGMIGATGLAAIALVAAGARPVEGRIDVRNAVYALFAAALLLAVVIDAAQHRHATGSPAETDPSAGDPWMALDPWSGDLLNGGSATSGPLLQELRLAARLGAELMGELPASRVRHD